MGAGCGTRETVGEAVAIEPEPPARIVPFHWVMSGVLAVELLADAFHFRVEAALPKIWLASCHFTKLNCTYVVAEPAQSICQTICEIRIVSAHKGF